MKKGRRGATSCIDCKRLAAASCARTPQGRASDRYCDRSGSSGDGIVGRSSRDRDW
jgi:hypothetical protein